MQSGQSGSRSPQHWDVNGQKNSSTPNESAYTARFVKERPARGSCLRRGAWVSQSHHGHGSASLLLTHDDDGSVEREQESLRTPRLLLKRCPRRLRLYLSQTGLSIHIHFRKAIPSHGPGQSNPLKSGQDRGVWNQVSSRRVCILSTHNPTQPSMLCARSPEGERHRAALQTPVFTD